MHSTTTTNASNPLACHKKYQLSAAQKSLLLACSYNSSLPGIYNVQVVVCFREVIDYNLLDQSWFEMQKKYEHFQVALLKNKEENETNVCIYSASNCPIERIDVSYLKTIQKNNEWKKYLNKDKNKAFDLIKPPLIRASIFKFSDKHYRMIFTFHHVLFDGNSFSKILLDFFNSYDAKKANKEYVIDNHHYPRPFLPEEEAESQKFHYWNSLLSDYSGHRALSIEKKSLIQPSDEVGCLVKNLSAHITEKIKRAARYLKSTPDIIFEAAWGLLLSKYTYCDDIVFLNIRSGPIKKEAGLFIKILPIRCKFESMNESVFSYLADIKQQHKLFKTYGFETTEKIFEYAGINFGDVMTAIDYKPIRPIEFMRKNGDEKAWRKRTGYFNTQTHYDLFLEIFGGVKKTSVKVNFKYNKFNANDIHNLVERYVMLLDNLVSNLHEKINFISLRDSKEYPFHKSFQHGKIQKAAETHVLSEFNKKVEKFPSNTCIANEKISLDYAEIYQSVLSFSKELTCLGVKNNDVVIIQANRSIKIIVTILSIMKLNAIYLPVHIDTPKDRLDFICKDSHAKFIVTDTEHLSLAEQLEIDVINIDNFILQNEQKNLNDKALSFDLNQIAYYIYTSGSTGKPKGVQINHASLSNFLIATRQLLEISSKDTILAITSLSFDISGFEIYSPLICGAQIFFADDKTCQDPLKIKEIIETHNITILQSTPSMLHMLLDAGWKNDGSIKVLCGGEPLSLTIAKRLLSEGQGFWHCYGPTETTIWSTINYVTNANIASYWMPIGQPILNTSLYILDKQQQQLPCGMVGEIYISGQGLAKGYVNTDLNKSRFVKINLDENEVVRLYRTGDLGCWRSDGLIEFKGRIDDQIKLRGFRIELGEIEQILSEYTLIKDVCVIINSDNLNPFMNCFFTADQYINIQDIRKFLENKLPQYMIPTHYQQLKQLPINKHGKIDKNSLALMKQLNSKNGKTELSSSEDLTQEVIIQAWRKFLNLALDSLIYKEDSFFSLGGNSLSAFQITSYINKELSLSISPNLLFNFPILNEFVDQIKLEKNSENRVISLLKPTKSRPEKIPLSFAQQRLWFLDQLFPNQTSYNLFAALKIVGNLDINILESSFHALLHRHEILRTTFCNKEGEIFQVINEPPTSNQSIIDVEIVDRDQVCKKVYAEAQKPFNLETGPLIRVSLIKTNNKEHILLVTLHHIICDGWSMNILGKEISALYRLAQENQQDQIHEVTLQYADYALWSRKQFTDDNLSSQLTYWKKHLSNLPILNLPTDFSRPSIQQHTGNRVTFDIDATLTSTMKSLASQYNTTLFNVLLSSFVTALAHYANQQDIVLGTPVAGRHYAGTENLIGLFVNTLVLRTKLKQNENFVDLLMKNHHMLSQAYDNQDVPFEKLVETLLPNRDLSRHPLCQVMIVMQNFELTPFEIAGTEIKRVFSDNDSLLLADYESAKFDLTLYLHENDKGIAGLFEYNVSLFKESTIQRFIVNFIELLSVLVTSPKLSILRQRFLSQQQKEQIFSWNGIERNYSDNKNIVKMIERQAEATPKELAIIFKQQSITYQELNEAANQLAHYLQAKDIKKNDLIGISLDRNINLVVAILAVLKSGAAYVPIDACLPKLRLKYIIEDSKVPFVITSLSYKEKLSAIRVDKLTDFITVDSDFSKFSKLNLANKISPDDFSYVIYTSGSTGKPKGVINQHRGTLNRIMWMQEEYPLTSQDRVLQKTPISFDVSVWELLWPLSIGAAIVLAEPQMHGDVDYLVSLITSQRVSVMHFVPSMLSSFLEHGEPFELNYLRHVFTSGEALTPILKQDFFDRFKNVSLHNLYGPTEASIDVTYWDCNPDDDKVPIGRPIANTKIYILNKQMNLVPIGVIGEICIAGEGLACGYVNKKQLTRDKFIDNPFDSGKYSKLYCTGDLGRWLEDGSIEYIGRIDRQIKIRGFRVELAEIEEILLNHSAVKQAAVIQDPNESKQQIVAYISIHKGKEIPDFDNLIAFMSQRLPKYMIPSSFTVLEKIPLLPSGKTDFQGLSSSVAQKTITCSRKNVSPVDEMQKQLIEIWSKHLSVKNNLIGINHDFFEVGGHSLLALKIIAAIQQTFSVKISTRDFFSSPTINQLSQMLKQKLLEKAIFKSNLTYIAKPNSPLVILQPKGDKTPLFLFHPVGGTVFCYMPLVSYLKKDRPIYAIQDPGIEASQPLYKTIREMTIDYLRIVKDVQPEGPYIIGGSSFGGTVAIEMAHQLTQAGEKIAFLPLLDLWALFTDEFRSRKRLEAGMHRQFNMLKERLNTENVPNPEPWLELNWHRMNLWLNYKPPIVETKITLFKAKELQPEYIPIDDLSNHWQQYSTLPVETVIIPGNHETMHLEPNAQVLAQKMQECLDKLDSEKVINSAMKDEIFYTEQV